MQERNILIKGTLVSLIAAVIILIALIYLQLNINNLEKIIIQRNFLLFLYMLFLLAILAYIIYGKINLFKPYLFRFPLLIGLTLVLIGLIFLTLKNIQGIFFLFIGYLAEPIAGIQVFKVYNKFCRKVSIITYISSVVFVLTLPLFLFKLGIIPVVANFIKLLGFILLFYTLQNHNLN